MRLVLLSLFLFLGMRPVLAGQNSSIWRIYPIEHFNIYYQPEDSLNARKVGRILQSEYPSISHDLQVSLASPVGLFIAPSYQSFLRLTGGAIPHWGEAVADPIKQIIVLKSPRWSVSTANLKTIVIHETVHVLLGQIVGSARIPRWLNEGLAVYFSGETGYFGGKQISRAQLTKQLIPLETIDAVLSFEQNKAQLAYQEAYYAVVYMVEQYGESAIPELLRALRKYKNFHVAFQRTFGESLYQFEQEWRYYLKKKYRWSIFMEFESLLWVLIFVLFVLVFVILLYKNRKTVARWDAEDALPPPSDPGKLS